MPTVIAHHDVKDTKHWLASPKREEVFGPLGVTNIRTFVDPENPTRVAVLMDVADMDVVSSWTLPTWTSSWPRCRTRRWPRRWHMTACCPRPW